MNPEKQTAEQRFQALGRLAVAAARGDDPRQLLEMAVAEAVEAVGLLAGAVRIFAAKPDQVDVAEAGAGDADARRRVAELERTLLSPLRSNWGVKSLFMTLDLDGPAGLFSYPLRSRDAVIGAITGLARGERNLAREEEFVGSLAAMIVLIGRTGPTWGEVPADRSAREEQARVQTVREVGTALNHEINNPLMAVLGNIELLLRKAPPLEADVVAKLGKVHEAAERIRDVTQGLVRITEVKTVPYPGGTRMLDIDGSPKGDEPS
ncbi:MAG: histidine kinase dimerization/phospho-acceptor domain-containing protein [Candidatus Zixiibacteriota bacterium]